MIISHSSRSTSPTSEILSKNSQSSAEPFISSPQIVAMKARITAQWQDLIYREALRMTGALRQIISQTSNNNRIQLVNPEVSFGNQNILIIIYTLINYRLFRLKGFWTGLMGYWENWEDPMDWVVWTPIYTVFQLILKAYWRIGLKYLQVKTSPGPSFKLAWLL